MYPMNLAYFFEQFPIYSRVSYQHADGVIEDNWFVGGAQYHEDTLQVQVIDGTETIFHTISLDTFLVINPRLTG